MSNLFTRSIALTIVTLCLGACGGGGGSSGGGGGGSTAQSALGIFNDAPVSGLSYTTSSGGSGTTNALGEFAFAPGDTVTFKAAGITLGSAIPVVLNSGTATVTPLDLVPGAAGVSDPGVTAIGQFLGTLNSIAVALNQNATGVFTVPTGSQVTAFYAALQGLGGTASALGPHLSDGSVQAAIGSDIGAGMGTVPTAANAQAGVTQGVNGAGFIGTAWSGTCTCGGNGTFYFQPDGAVIGFTSDGGLLSGSWTGSSTAAGGIQFSLLATDGGYSSLITLPSGATSGSGTIFDNSGASQGTFSFSPIASAGPVVNSAYVGGWYGIETPNATGAAAGDTGGSAYFIVAADGTLRGVSQGGAILSGTWNAAAGTATASFTDSGQSGTVALDLAAKSGTVSVGGAVHGTAVISRTGTFSVGKPGGSGSGSGSGSPIPLLLNVRVNWPQNVGNAVSSFALSLTVRDSGGNPIANAAKPEANPLGLGAIANSTTDNISASYASGSGASYSLSVGPSNCSLSGASGSVVDANSGHPEAYPTVTVSCR